MAIRSDEIPFLNADNTQKHTWRLGAVMMGFNFRIGVLFHGTKSMRTGLVTDLL